MLWAHHKEVIDALVEAVPAHLKSHDRQMIGVIAGSTSADERGRLVDEFQAGRLPVLVCSITAAGVGITLTRGSDAYWLEADWSVPLQTQSEDRQWRIGQDKPITCTTLLAEGTLDGRIQQILTRKAKFINAVMDGGDADVAVMSKEEMDDAAAPSEIIESLVNMVIERRSKAKRNLAA